MDLDITQYYIFIQQINGLDAKIQKCAHYDKKFKDKQKSNIIILS